MRSRALLDTDVLKVAREYAGRGVTLDFVDAVAAAGLTQSAAGVARDGEPPPARASSGADEGRGSFPAPPLTLIAPAHTSALRSQSTAATASRTASTARFIAGQPRARTQGTSGEAQFPGARA